MRYKTKDIGEGGIDLRVVVTQAWLAAECKEASVGLAEGGMTLRGPSGGGRAGIPAPWHIAWRVARPLCALS